MQTDCFTYSHTPNLDMLSHLKLSLTNVITQNRKYIFLIYVFDFLAVLVVLMLETLLFLLEEGLQKI